jgi:malate synthase
MPTGNTRLERASQLVGWRGEAAAPSAVLLKNHGLHIEIQIDHTTAVSNTDGAGVSDIVMEAALSTIIDRGPGSRSKPADLQ